MISDPRFKRALKISQAVLYLAFIFLWFKHSFPAFKGIGVSWLWAFVPLAAVTAARLAVRIKSARLSLRTNWRRDAAALGLLAVLATAAHLPFLAHSFGLMDSDEAVPALMGKHIAEGRPAPLYFYGANFQGSLPEHYAAVLYRLFGYSVFLAKLSAWLAFVVFLGAQFFLLKRSISFEFACAVGVFYVLPWEHLVRTSLDLGSGFPIVLLLGVLIFYWTQSIVYDGRLDRLAGLGFLLGLAFWTHQISVVFGLAAAPFLVQKLRLRVRSYVPLATYFLIGSFPVLLNEFARGFPIVRFLYPGEAGPPLAARFVRAGSFVLVLFSSAPARLALFSLAVLAGGVITLVILAAKKRIHPAALLYPVDFVIFLVIFVLSRFSNTGVLRYMYVLYIAVPVLLAAPFLWIRRSRIRYPGVAAFFVLLFVAGQAGTSAAYYSTVKADDRAYSQAIAAMTETGEKYWISDFWASYLLTSLSRERLIVASYGVRRYFPYALWYWAEGRNNWVLFRDRPDMELYASTLPDILSRAGVGFEQKELDRFTLVYRVSQDIFPKIIMADPPGRTPDIRLATITSADGRLNLGFVRDTPGPTPGLGFMVEIQDYSVRLMPIPEKVDFSAQIPFPEKSSFLIRYGLTYAGLHLPGSLREREISTGQTERDQQRAPVEFLKGIGPQKEVLGRRMSVCAKEARLEINAAVGKAMELTLDLYSPFDFSNPSWYGDFSQSVSIFVNDQPLGERSLAYGKNTVVIKVEPPLWRGRDDVVSLRFRYAMPLGFDENWKTAAYLGRLTLK
jgi:hypothetical protein